MSTLKLLLLFFLVSTGLFSCKRKEIRSREKNAAAIVDVMVAKRINFPYTIEVNGTALAEEMVELYPEIGGRLIYLNIPDGETVTKGTVLAKVNDAELQAQLEQQKVLLDLAVKTEQRLKKLLSVNGVNQSEYDAAISQVNNLGANIKVIEAQIDKTIVRAPFNGKLGLRLVSPGAFVTPQTLLGTLQQTDKIKIDFTVPESFSIFVKAGTSVVIQTVGTEEKHPAEIKAIEPQIDINTRNIKVRASLRSSRISPGAFVKVLFDKKVDGIAVPSNAIIPDASSNQVIIVKNQKALFRNVETGIRNAELVELISGVDPGDTIVVSGVLFVRPNALVKIRNINNQESKGL